MGPAGVGAALWAKREQKRGSEAALGLDAAQVDFSSLPQPREIISRSMMLRNCARRVSFCEGGAAAPVVELGNSPRLRYKNKVGCLLLQLW